MSNLDQLKEYIRQYDSAVIAFSGGVDSTFLAKVVADTIHRVLLVTATSSTYPESELKESKELAQSLGISQRIIVSEELDIVGFSDNPPDRCYYCKSELFTKIAAIAKEEGYAVVFDGSNSDDTRDYRPGRRALSELGIKSPLCDTGLTKEEIRKYSKEMNLTTATKATFACLASRFPYGEKITKEKLGRVGSAEEALRKLGFIQFRVRSHGDLARVEIAKNEMDHGWQNREEILRICKEVGYIYATFDLDGYRTGAMNEVLKIT